MRDADMDRLKETPLEIVLRDLRESGANRGEPCGVHDRPQWTCAFCLYNALAAAPPPAELVAAKEALRLQTERADFQQRRADKWVAIAERYGATLADLKDAEAPSAESAHP